jgi:hypothetical protein
MAKLGTHQIRDLAKSFIAANPGGIRYTTLIDFISAQSPETPREHHSWVCVEPAFVVPE